MRNHVNKLVAILVFFIIVTEVNAQEVIPAGGGTAEGNGGKLTFTVGQLLYCTNMGSGGTVSEGVQQPYEIWVYSGVEETSDVSLTCSVFPNPVGEKLTLQIRDLKNIKLSFHLYDANGRTIENNTIEKEETQISVKNLLPGTYFLKVISNEKDVKKFKIIKL